MHPFFFLVLDFYSKEKVKKMNVSLIVLRLRKEPVA